MGYIVGNKDPRVEGILDAHGFNLRLGFGFRDNVFPPCQRVDGFGCRSFEQESAS